MAIPTMTSAVRVSNFGKEKKFYLLQTVSGAYLTYYLTGTEFFPGG
jgi:hypothetical protein